MTATFQGRLGAVVLSAAAFGFSPVASAALLCAGASPNTVGTWTCIETSQFGPATTDLTNAPFTLDKWLSLAAPGFTQTLLSVSWTLGGAVHTTGTLTNGGAATQTFSLTESETFSWSAGLGAPASFLPAAVLATASSPALGFTLAGGASTPLTVDLFPGPVTMSTSSGLAGYFGPGTFQANLSTLTGVNIVGGGANISTSLITTATPQIMLTYTFETVSLVPEPGSMALLGAGMAVVLAVVRRRAKVNSG